MRYIVKFVVKFVKISNKKKEKQTINSRCYHRFPRGRGGDKGQNLHDQVHEHMLTVCTSCINIHPAYMHV
jgi:hypothetical protein